MREKVGGLEVKIFKICQILVEKKKNKKSYINTGVLYEDAELKLLANAG